jgi:hypothetical protein
LRAPKLPLGGLGVPSIPQLQDRTDSEITRARKSKSKQGENNPFYGKGPGIKALDIAAEKAGTKVYVYDATGR